MQDYCKDWAEQIIVSTVLVCSEGLAPHIMHSKLVHCCAVQQLLHCCSYQMSCTKHDSVIFLPRKQADPRISAYITHIDTMILAAALEDL